MQRVHRYVSTDLSIRAASVNATDVVLQMQQISNSQPLPTVAVGRAMIGSLLMVSQLKEGQEIGLLIKGNGPLSSVYAHAHFSGQVRGYCSAPQYEPGHYDENLSISQSIGNGHLTVVRHQPFQRQPYLGTVNLVSGEIGEDIASYLHQSQQIRSIISLGVYLDSFGRVKSAGGVLVEIMPGVEGDVVAKLEANFSSQKAQVSKMILDGKSPEQLVAPFLTGFELTEIPHDFALQYHCPCSRERVLNSLVIMGLTELDDMIAKEEKAQVTCEMCGKHYVIEVDEIKEVRNHLYKNSLN